jgi:GntR family transcriptional regulator/MocR family aminotransferase
MRPANERRVAWELLLEVELRPRQMRRAVGEALRRAIQDGWLPAQTVLPSSRRLAAELGVSRGVITDVYEQLAAEGYIEVSDRVAPVVAAVVEAAPAAAEEAAPNWRFDLNAVTPDVSLFPAECGPGRSTGRCGRRPTTPSTTQTTEAGRSCELR